MGTTRPHPSHANVVVLRPGLVDGCRDVVSRAAGHFNQAVGELDRALARVGDRLDETVRAGQAAVRAGKLAYRQQRRQDRVRGPLGLVAGYTPSNNR
ncbi:MAG TPA: hypothetical protein VKE97_09635 [Acidimicrobiia bacterium]|nr:hypothetical protein [Acidimicrobiia bacterium]